MKALQSRAASADFSAGNQLQLLESGTEYFPALVAAINDAREEVHLETYIFADDEAGRAVADALAAAARRGVAVRVLVDGFGARDFADGLGVELSTAGVEVLVYRPELARLELSRRRLRRLHRKLVVIDGRIGFIGGINVIDDFDMGNTPQQTPPRFDYAVRIEGPLVDAMHAAVRHVWQLVRWARLGRRPPPPRPLTRWVNSRVGEISARFVQRDNLRNRHAIENAYLAAINSAQREIIIANAYFLPGRRFRRALELAAKRGVKVTLLLQGRIEYALLHYATLGLYRLLSKQAIRIVEYRASFLHAKVAVIDGAWATVGSSNIDPFSLLLAREANVVINDAGFAGVLRASLLLAIARGGCEVSHDEIVDWPWWQSLGSRAAYAAVRVLLNIGVGHAHATRQA
jgi:cardiolipin synthase